MGDIDFWNITSTIIYGFLGIFLFIAGYMAFDRFVQLDLCKELVEDQNTALGIMLAGLFVSMAIIVSTVIR